MSAAGIVVAPPVAPRARRPAWGRAEELDARLAGLAAGGTPLRRAAARLAGRMVAGRGWERLGFARLADYARERLGVSAREVRDLARVDAALAGLRQVEAAFVSGRLGWTQVRLLCRVARPEGEAAWIAAAERLTAAELAREVRAVDRCAAGEESDGEDDERENVVVRCSGRVRAKWWRACQLARRTAGEKLPTWACAEAMAAEVLSALPKGGAIEAPVAQEPLRSRGTSDRCARKGLTVRSARAGPPIEITELLDGIDDLDSVELDARLRRAIAFERRLLAELAPLLCELAGARLFLDLGVGSVDAYAHERLGMSPRTARALLRLERACGRAPELREAWHDGQLSWCQALVLVPLMWLDEARAWRGAWVARAGQVTLRRLEDDVDFAIAHGQLDPALLPTLPAGVQIGAEPRTSEPEESGEREDTRLFFNAPRDVARLFRAALASVQRHLEREAGAPVRQSNALDVLCEHALATWWGAAGPLGSREQRVFERDGWRCTAPGCSSYANLHAHHIRFRSAGGADALENLTTLCAWHHLRGVHFGVIRLRGRAPGRLRFTTPVGVWLSGDIVSP